MHSTSTIIHTIPAIFLSVVLVSEGMETERVGERERKLGWERERKLGWESVARNPALARWLFRMKSLRTLIVCVCACVYV